MRQYVLNVTLKLKSKKSIATPTIIISAVGAQWRKWATNEPSCVMASMAISIGTYLSTIERGY